MPGACGVRSLFCTLLSLFASRAFHNSFTIKRFHTLSQNCRGVTQQFPFWNLSWHFFTRLASALLCPLSFRCPPLHQFPTLQPCKPYILPSSFSPPVDNRRFESHNS